MQEQRIKPTNKKKEGSNMSHFYGQITRSARKTMPTARAHKTTGLETRARSWQGDIRVVLNHDDETGKDTFSVCLCGHHEEWGQEIAFGNCDGSAVTFTNIKQKGSA